MRRICIITGGLATSHQTDSSKHIQNIVNLIKPSCVEIYVICINFPLIKFDESNIHIININHDSASKFILNRIGMFVILQIEIGYQLMKLWNKIDIAFFAIGAAILTWPMVIAKSTRKKVVYIYPGAGVVEKAVNMTYSNKSGAVQKTLLLIVNTLERINCKFSNKIVVLSLKNSSVVFNKYSGKVIQSSRFFVNTEFFNITKDMKKRKTIVGFVGRLSEEKGISNFIEAVPLILKQFEDIKFAVIGDGPLVYSLQKKITEYRLKKVITMLGYVPHHEIAKSLNNFKLIVIPSTYEVGPQALLEAMACGTPVLATPVGIIPEVIEDGGNGFIMEDNSPECIARNLIRALNHPNLGNISMTARRLVEEEYTYQAAVDRYHRIITSLK